MLIGYIEGATRVLGKAQDYNGLRIRDVTGATADGGQLRAMNSAWFPTPEKLAKPAVDAPPYITVVDMEHPPT